jgi:Uma2 family endonuclease
MPAIATMSGAQFDALPYEEGRRWELLEGELIEVPSPTPEHQDIVFASLLALKLYIREHRFHGAV